MRLRKRKRCFPSCSSLRKVDEDEIYWRHRKEDEELEWTPNSTHLISQLTQCFTNAMVGSRSWIGGLFHRTSTKRNNDKFVDYPLSPIEEERLQRLQERVQVAYDETRPEHQEALRALWVCSFPNVSLEGLISDQWKDMGWQGPNPSTDFRGCGFISLENLLFFARKYPASFHRLLLKKEGIRATWEYPFAVAGINISYMLIQMLDLYSEKPRCLPGANFLKLLGDNEEAFDILYCIAFEMMDAQWLAMHASYMDFNDVLNATRIQLERELSLEDINRIQDLPAYNLL
ncbi:ELMO domain-containing protein A isoform X1 [Vigna radiata var. radiata]|uniref:ELMO domain-containing protein A isoform X1 n=2 Tax=Vigna radiata var. radiata TaxID=3916 RepID=A0A1S3THL0_VIGRR|nr:ELMO domain-containing protein A isoform X1 [Vigna radiata var. radiata]